MIPPPLPMVDLHVDMFQLVVLVPLMVLLSFASVLVELAGLEIFQAGLHL